MLCLQCTSLSRQIKICARRSQRYVSGKVYEYIQSARVPHQRSSKDEVRRRFSLGTIWASHFGKFCNQKTSSIPQVAKTCRNLAWWLNKSNTKCTILIHLGNISSNMQHAVETKLWNHSKNQPEIILIFQNFLCLASFQVSYSYSGAPSHLVPHLNE